MVEALNGFSADVYAVIEAYPLASTVLAALFVFTVARFPLLLSLSAAPAAGLFFWFYAVPTLSAPARTGISIAVGALLVLALFALFWYGLPFVLSLFGEWLSLRTVEHLSLPVRLLGPNGWVGFFAASRGLSVEAVETLRILISDREEEAAFPDDLTPLVRAARSLH